jgi:hypothetical protein
MWLTGTVGLVIQTAGEFGQTAEIARPLFGRSPSSEPLGMLVELLNLRMKALTMSTVLGRVDGLTLERGVLRAQRIHFLPKPVVLGGNVVGAAHLQIVARQAPCAHIRSTSVFPCSSATR